MENKKTDSNKKIYFLRAKLTNNGIKIFDKKSYGFRIKNKKYIIDDNSHPHPHILSPTDMKIWSRPMEFTANGWCKPTELREFKKKCLSIFLKDLNINKRETNSEIARLTNQISGFEKAVNRYCK